MNITRGLIKQVSDNNHCFVVRCIRFGQVLKPYSRRWYSTPSNIIYSSSKVADLLQKQPDSLRVFDDYLSDAEYANFLKEIDGFMKRKRYEYSHWDDVCKFGLSISTKVFYAVLSSGYSWLSRGGEDGMDG